MHGSGTAEWNLAGKDAVHAEYQDALRQTMEEEIQRENSELQEALLRSKVDVWSADGVTLCRLTFHSPSVMSSLFHSDALAMCCSRVESAGCEVWPSWANGALLLVPVTEEQVAEAGVQLKTHHILMLASDAQRVKGVLDDLPRRRRPQLKPEQLPPNRASASFAEEDTIDAETSASARRPCEGQRDGEWLQQIGLVVERTFLSFPLHRDISEASDAVQSAPAAGALSSELINPHRWRLNGRSDGV
jgi:hypothetical protein